MWALGLLLYARSVIELCAEILCEGGTSSKKGVGCGGMGVTRNTEVTGRSIVLKGMAVNHSDYMLCCTIVHKSSTPMIVKRRAGVRRGYAVRIDRGVPIRVKGGIAIKRGTIVRKYAVKGQALVKVKTIVLSNTGVKGSYVVKTKDLIAGGATVPSNSLMVKDPTEVGQGLA